MLGKLFELFFTFARIGAVTFGGGYAMLPILQHELVKKRNWTTDEDLADYFAIGQCTPGVIAVNVATFIGRKRAGIFGGIFATLGVVFPSLVIISLLAGVIQIYAEIQWVKHAFAGIRACVCVLIFNAVYKLWRKSVIDIYTLGIYLAILAGAMFLNLSPVIFVLISGAAGVIVNVWRVKK
mgnify:CR=1 FL=1